jgi:hypothetical protein
LTLQFAAGGYPNAGADQEWRARTASISPTIHWRIFTRCDVYKTEAWREVQLTGQQVFATSLLCVWAFVGDATLGWDNLASATNDKFQMYRRDSARVGDWERRWSSNIIRESHNGYCDKEMGEEIGWVMSPLLKSFYYGYNATGDSKWVRMLMDCTDAWIKRAVTEPDGYPGWPKVGAAGTPVDGLDAFYADSLLGEAMALRPVVLMSMQILSEPRLRDHYGAKADNYIKLSETIFEKWDRRGAWRNTEGGGTISVVLPFGIDQKTSIWTSGYEVRNAPGNGFSHPDNKANLVACWLLAMFDATGDPKYKDRAARWFRLMKSRMTPNDDGTYRVWNYWQPAGPWDYNSRGLSKHWIGVHPNPGYYGIDVGCIVTAFEHDVVFNKDDINRLVATSLAQNRSWDALIPYSEAIQKNFEKNFEENHGPDSWGGLSITPWYLAIQSGKLGKGRYMP